MDKVPMTLSGHTRLEEELKHLKSVERPSIVKAIAEAREHGDLSENAEYHAARERQSFVEGRIEELEDKISRAEVIDVSSLNGKSVKFGAWVTLVDEDTDEEVKYQIVGEDESDIKDKRISVGSPLARALIGKSVNDSVEVTTPGGTKSYEITKVAFK
ncbi:MAG: transcription elongation factor GreA [Alphaproteobacteria bacterium]|nr:transcription elongation factor GreA [Alphaproteobacteria bacterium]